MFAEVIYSQETGYHRTRGANNHIHLGFPEGWSRGQVATYGRKLTGMFPGARIAGQCRSDNVRPPGGSANSLHYVSNGCRALDIDTVWPSGGDKEDQLLLRMEAWARGQTDLAQPTDVAFAGAGDSLRPLLKEIGLGVAAFLGGITALGIGMYMIAKDQGIA